MDQILFVSLMADNTARLYAELTSYLGRRLHISVRVVDQVPWQERERMLDRGTAQLGAVCGLQYVYASDRGEWPGVEPLAAPVMQSARYGDRPIYFSDVVVRKDSPARCLGDLRGAAWAYNEPTSQSGYNITRYTLAVRGLTDGLTDGFFGRVISSGTHQRSLALVLDGTVDGSAIDSTVLEQELRIRPELGQRVRVIETLGPSPIPPLVASRALSPGLRAAICETLLALHLDAASLALLGSGGIARMVPVADADYDPIRQMARIGSVARL